MMTVHVAADTQKLDAVFLSLEKNTAPVLIDAANRAATRARKVAKESTEDKYWAKAGDIGKKARIKKAGSGRAYASVYFDGRHVNLITYKVSPRHPVIRRSHKKRLPKVYKAAVKRTGVKPLEDAERKPFVANVKNGFTGVFRRKPNSRKIEGVSGPSVPQIVKNKDTMQRVYEEAEKMMEKRIEHGIDRALQ